MNDSCFLPGMFEVTIIVADGRGDHLSFKLINNQENIMHTKIMDKIQFYVQCRVSQCAAWITYREVNQWILWLQETRAGSNIANRQVATGLSHNRNHQLECPIVIRNINKHSTFSTETRHSTKGWVTFPSGKISAKQLPSILLGYKWNSVALKIFFFWSYLTLWCTISHD